MSAGQRRTAAYTKLDLTLIELGLELLINECYRKGERFQAVAAESTLGHVKAVMAKMDKVEKVGGE